MKTLTQKWRNSLVLKVMTVSLLITAVMIWIIGSALFTQISQGIIDEKIQTSVSETRATIRSSQFKYDIASSQDRATIERITREILHGAEKQVGGNTSGREILLLKSPDQSTGRSSNISSEGSSNEVLNKSIPQSLRDQIKNSADIVSAQGLIYYVFTKPVPAIIAGGTLVIPKDGIYEMYLLFSLKTQYNTLDMIERALWATGIILTLLLGLTIYLVVRQVLRPIQVAARIAQQFTTGDFTEKMEVKSRDEVGRLGEAINDMAISIEQQISRLENLSRLQQRFVSDVSHELWTPLTTVKMAADIIYSTREEFPPNIKRSAELLISQIDRFQNLLSSLLEISRFDAEAATLVIEDSDLVGLLQGALDHVANDSSIDIHLDLPEGRLLVPMDARRIERVIRNLLSNAIDHSAGKSITVSIAQNDSAVALGVRDHGLGFDRAQAARLFERFWRADPSRARSRGGTGLGLAIALEDAKLHHGTLEAWGEVGHGAHFVLTLPKQSGGTIEVHPIPLVPQDE